VPCVIGWNSENTSSGGSLKVVLRSLVLFETSFRIRRDIRYRNSFLPLVWGNIVPTPMGARVVVTMFMHPLVLAFLGMLVWGALKSGSSAELWGTFMFLTALSAAGFIPEVVKAKRLLSAVVLSSGSSDHKRRWTWKSRCETRAATRRVNPLNRRNIKGCPFWSRVWVLASNHPERNTLL
jgi:hypothetical protein